jgi:hypothetical protein
MSEKIKGTSDNLALIHNKLDGIELVLKTQQEGIMEYIAQNPDSIEAKELVAGFRSNRTAFELLRDEIDELSLFIRFKN